MHGVIWLRGQELLSSSAIIRRQRFVPSRSSRDRIVYDSDGIPVPSSDIAIRVVNLVIDQKDALVLLHLYKMQAVQDTKLKAGELCRTLSD